MPLIPETAIQSQRAPEQWLRTLGLPVATPLTLYKQEMREEVEGMRRSVRLRSVHDGR